MKFAFLIMGKFNSETDKAAINNGVSFPGAERTKSEMITDVMRKSGLEASQYVYIGDTWSDVDAACENGIDCIELCGAFGAEGARKIIEATENKIPVGYVTHLPEQEEVYQAAFPQK